MATAEQVEKIVNAPALTRAEQRVDERVDQLIEERLKREEREAAAVALEEECSGCGHSSQFHGANGCEYLSFINDDTLKVGAPTEDSGWLSVGSGEVCGCMRGYLSKSCLSCFWFKAQVDPADGKVKGRCAKGFIRKLVPISGPKRSYATKAANCEEFESAQ